MGEGAIGLGHFVSVFLLLHHVARIIVSVDDLGGESVLHRHAFAAAGGVNDPTERKALLAFKRNFDRNLIGGATNPAAFHLEAGACSLESTKQKIHRINLLEL